MKLRLPPLICGLLALPALRAAGPPPADAGNFAQNRKRIEALFRGRDAAPVLPTDVINPFSSPQERALARSGGSNAAGVTFGSAAPLSDHALLERVAPSIEVRGIVLAADRPSIIINRKLFSEGDILTVLYGESTLEIVIKRITSETFTLGYGNAELTLRLPR